VPEYSTKWLYHFVISSAVYEVSSFCKSLSTLVHICLFHYSYNSGYKVLSYVCAHTCFLFLPVLGIHLKTVCVLGKCFTTELHASSSVIGVLIYISLMTNDVETHVFIDHLCILQTCYSYLLSTLKLYCLFITEL
jgi:hypothetical protein